MIRLSRLILGSCLLLPVTVVSGRAASVKPLEVVSDKILIREIEHHSSEHILASTLLRKSVDRLNRDMNITSEKSAGESLRLLADISERLAAAKKSSSALSRYLESNRSRLRNAGYDRYLPLAGMDKEIEGPYFGSLENFLSVSKVFVKFCMDNFEAVSSGKQEEAKRYEEYYAAYLKAMENFNDNSVSRSQRLADMGSDHPLLWELLPR